MRKNLKNWLIKGFLVGLSLVLITSTACAGIFTPIFRELIIDPAHRMIYVGVLNHWVATKGTLFARNVDKLLIFNPSPANNPGIANLMQTIIKLVQPFYILAIVGIALYLVFLSGSPKGRTKAKASLQRVIISMFAFTLSPLILNLLLHFSQSLTEAAFNITGVEPITEILVGGFHGAWVVISWLAMPNFALGANPWSYTLFFMAWFPYMYVSIRNIILTLLEIAFPLSILLYSFNYTRGIGRGLLEQTIGWTLLQFFWTLVLVALVLSAAPLRGAIVENPLLGGINLPHLYGLGLVVLGPIGIIAGHLLTTPTIPALSTDIFTLMLGITGYGMIAALPFILITLLRGFLP